MLPPPLTPSCFRFVLACLFGLLTTGLPIWGQAWSTNAAVGFTHNDNVTNSAQEEKADSAVFASVDYGTHRLLSRDLQGSFKLTAASTHWLDYEGLDLSDLTATAGLRWKFGLGPYAPRLDTHVTVGRLLARVDEWSGNQLRIDTQFSRRLSPAWLLAASVELNRLDAKRAVYSHTQWTYAAAAHYDPTPDWRISLRLRHRQGDQLSWCRNSWPSFAGTPQWLDGIFGGDWFPYRTEARLNGASLTVSRALGHASSISAGVESTRSTSSAHKTYRNTVLTLQFVHAF
ncbi:hypothetical protein [Actomonas aquatica]|uniref:Uncharacterized protein n=1 Tax=Actomonas aquatica TaxID=2866162 RepID=A0ABZ1C8G3_9BACT|nr:hypothetical protein [Opitutus sp. WL0086]WRQ86610.1 hypothetical protein K1X11_017500 [Opitutus sp. WL0086]